MGLPFLLEPFAFRDQIVFALLSVIVSWAAIHAITTALAHTNSVDAPRVGNREASSMGGKGASRILRQD